LADTMHKQKTGSKPEPRWLTTLRKQAQARYSQMGWPTPQEEEWRRTDLSDIPFDAYTSADPQSLQPERSTGKEGPIAESSSQSEEGSYGGSIRFYNGSLESLHLQPQWRERGVRLAVLNESVEGSNSAEGLQIRSLFNRSNRSIDNRLQAWNHSLWDHGVYLYIPPSVEVTEPLLFDFLLQGEKQLSMPRVLVYLDRGARATVIQRVSERGQGEVLCNAGLHLLVGENAGLDMVSIQNLGSRSLFFNHGEASVQRDGTLRTFEALFGARLSKTRLDCSLEETGSEARLNGLYFAREDQHMDIRSIQRHNAPQTNSRSFYKGAVRDSSRTIYQGLIEVSPLASKTDAYLTNRNLILSSGARADSIPSLKIDTNDVLCSHGSTTGRLNPEDIFYLMSRGLPRREAEKLLIGGFFEEVLQQAPAVASGAIRKLIQDRL